MVAYNADTVTVRVYFISTHIHICADRCFVESSNFAATFAWLLKKYMTRSYANPAINTWGLFYFGTSARLLNALFKYLTISIKSYFLYAGLCKGGSAFISSFSVNYLSCFVRSACRSSLLFAFLILFFTSASIIQLLYTCMLLAGVMVWICQSGVGPSSSLSLKLYCSSQYTR